MKKIMILAGGNDQVALIEQLRIHFSGDVEIILVDQSKTVRARSYADKFYPVSTMDKDAVLKVAKAEKIDYILTACGDQPLSTMAYVAEQMRLPSYLSQSAVRDLTNKKYMKEKMLRCGIPTSKYIHIEKDRNRPSISSLSYPLVVKPVDSNGSKGVIKVSNDDELDRALDEAFSYTLSGKVIIEEFKEGEELSIDVYVENTTAKLLSVTSSKKIEQNKDAFTIVQSFYPPQTAYDEKEILHIAQKIVDGFLLKDTPLLIQLIVNNGDYNVIEFSARMGGGSKYKLIQILSGVNIMQVYVDMVMGNAPKVNPMKQVNYAIMSYVYCNNGVYTKLCNFDKLLHSGCIKDYFVYKNPDTSIVKSNTSSDRVAGFLVVGDTLEEAKNRLDYANRHLRVLDPNGIDIMKHDIY